MCSLKSKNTLIPLKGLIKNIYWSNGSTEELNGTLTIKYNSSDMSLLSQIKSEAFFAALRSFLQQRLPAWGIVNESWTFNWYILQ